MFKSDLYGFSELLSAGEKAVLGDLEKALETHVRSKINPYWEKAEFPFEAFYKAVREAKLMSDARLFEGREDHQESQIYNVFKYFQLAKFDASIATFYTVHGGLFRAAIAYGGSDEQKKYYLPKVESFEIQGCFGLTEPDHGSDIAGGLATTAKRVGNTWVLNGYKRWIGGAGSADEIAIFARDTDDNKVKCFIVPGKAKGLTVEKIENKIAIRMVQNGHITLENVEVDDSRRLIGVDGFKDVAEILKRTRAEISYLATGMQAGALEAALTYVKNRMQFNRPVASFQIIQEKLARMFANVTASLAMSVSLAKEQEAGLYSDVHSAMAKMHNALRLRETVALAREVCGGNGITLDTDVARFFADAEAIYSYEGTHEINALIIGRYLTGMSAFNK